MHSLSSGENGENLPDRFARLRRYRERKLLGSFTYDSWDSLVLIGGYCGYTDLLCRKLLDQQINAKKVLVRGGDLESEVVKPFDTNRELQALMDQVNADIYLVAFYDHKIPPEIVREYEGRLWNLHGSPLPEFCGPDPVTEMLEQGLEHGAVTVHLVTNKIDQGDILGFARFKFQGQDPDYNYRRVVIPKGAELTAKCFNQRGILRPIPQRQLIGEPYTNIESRIFT